MDGLLRHRRSDLFGVLNAWITRSGTGERRLPRRHLHRPRFQTRQGTQQGGAPGAFGLRWTRRPLYGMVSRLVDQKGFGALCGPAHGSLAWMCANFDLQFAILGTGDAWCERELTSLAGRYRTSRAHRLDERLAHLVQAGSDFFLMRAPTSRAPRQMYALRYGTLPIVRRTGGLADTVVNYDQPLVTHRLPLRQPDPGGHLRYRRLVVVAWHNRHHLDAMRKRG